MTEGKVYTYSAVENAVQSRVALMKRLEELREKLVKKPAVLPLHLTILTPSMRHELLPEVAKSISAAERPDDIVLRWTVRYNPPTRMAWEEHIRRWDAELKSLKDTWVLILADDNVLHPAVVKRWSETVKANPAAKVIHVRQQISPSKFRPAGLDYLDGGQLLFDANFYNSFNWSYDTFGWEGYLFRKMWEKSPESFVFLDEHLAYHDKLDW